MQSTTGKQIFYHIKINIVSENNILIFLTLDHLSEIPDALPFAFLGTAAPDLGVNDDSDDEPFCDSDDLDDILADMQPSDINSEDISVTGIIASYLSSVKDKLQSEITNYTKPDCYRNNTFWILPPDPYFALCKSYSSAGGLDPSGLYYPKVFVWLPEYLGAKRSITCQTKGCIYYQDIKNPMQPKGWNDDPVARRVVGLDRNYYIITKRLHCHKSTDSDGGGCGKSFNWYDPIVMDQLEPGLASEFPAFLTHRSGIDKTLMSLIRAGIAHRVSSSAWSKILCELHVREHDIRELKYLHYVQKDQKFQKENNSDVKAYSSFSDFDDKLGYGGFYALRWYINSVYIDYMFYIRPSLDQCLSALTGYIIKWDHSFKLVKYMMKLDGVVTFTALFTLVNEYEQIRYQAFVPTKALSHLKAGLEGFIDALHEHGIAEPVLGFTDNVSSDAATFLECIPSLNKDVSHTNTDEHSDLPRLVLPGDVSVNVCGTESEIQNACLGIMELLSLSNDKLYIGFDMEWEFSTGFLGTGPQKTALIQIALPTSVYLLRVLTLKKLPISLEAILCSSQIIKIGQNIGADFAKIGRDFPDCKLPNKSKKSYSGVIELGRLAAKKNVVPNAQTSLTSIVAATLQLYLSKEFRSTEWGAEQLSDDQIQYAALDAYAGLLVWDVLKNIEHTGQPISVATDIGQLVSLYVRNHEVAQGVIIEQPSTFTILDSDGEPVSLGVSKTKTWALIEIDTVLAPNCVIAHHRQSLKNIQKDQISFKAVVSISALRTRNDQTPISSQPPKEKRNIGHINVGSVIRPPLQSPQSSELSDDDPDSDAESELDDDEMISKNQNELERSSGFTQTNNKILAARILADVFHEMDKVCRTISKKHTLCKKFATAFSDTLLVPDEDDKKLVSEVLLKKKLTYEKVRSKSPAWLWKRVCRYIPESGILVLILTEFFNCWGKIKCPITGQPLFSAETWKKTQGVLHDVRKGWLSDPSLISVYTQEGTDKNGLPLYHCIRGTNSVEGAIHNPIRRNFASLNASMELSDALIADFRHRHNADTGSLHKTGIKYSGHYDPWLDHEIRQLREDIFWTVQPKNPPGRAIHDTDPLNFAPTKEKFGITAIPPMVHIRHNFSGPTPRNLTSDHSHKFWLSKLTGWQSNVYDFLAEAQQTKYAVTPLHTSEEYDLFHKAVSIGGEWCAPKGKPNFEAMAGWWSEKANGKTIFYKLTEHLATYYKLWSDWRQENQTMVISRPQREPHEKRI